MATIFVYTMATIFVYMQNVKGRMNQTSLYIEESRIFIKQPAMLCTII